MDKQTFLRVFYEVLGDQIQKKIDFVTVRLFEIENCAKCYSYPD